jgi:hypothetical protein
MRAIILAIIPAGAQQSEKNCRQATSHSRTLRVKMSRSRMRKFLRSACRMDESWVTATRKASRIVMSTTSIERDQI